METMTILAGAVGALGCTLVVCTGAHAQQSARYGLAPAVSHRPSVAQVSPSRILIRSYPVYVGATTYRSPPASYSTPPARGPYLSGPGQWVPSAQQADAMALSGEPGDTRATPAAASGHWDWKRTSLAELVEISRRNKASSATE